MPNPDKTTITDLQAELYQIAATLTRIQTIRNVDVGNADQAKDTATQAADAKQNSDSTGLLARRTVILAELDSAEWP